MDGVFGVAAFGLGLSGLRTGFLRGRTPVGCGNRWKDPRYIRSGGPTGDRINIEQATFDFSEEVRKVDAGLMASADYFFTKKMAVFGQLSWGLVPIFPEDFEGLSYKMYNIYFSLGLAYRL